MKKGEDRKQAIIGAAEKLFYEKGYENTSVQDVLDALKFSKGGFYHHFESKSKLLEALCEQRTEALHDNCENAVRACRGNAVEKLNALLSSSSILMDDSLDFLGLLLRVAYQDGSVMLRDGIKSQTMQRLLPMMDEIIWEGVTEGVFFTAHPDSVGKLILLLGTNLTDEMSEIIARSASGSEELLAALEILDAYRNSVELLLNAPYGSVSLMDMKRVMEISEGMIQQSRRQKWSEFSANAQ